MKQSTHQFHKIFFHISKCLACNAGKTLQLKIQAHNQEFLSAGEVSENFGDFFPRYA